MDWTEYSELPGKIRNRRLRALFVCLGNASRSQMAEAFLKEICGDHFEARSAGLEPGSLNPLAVEAMREIGIDISHNQTQSVFDVFKSGELFAYVITVCDNAKENCPYFPANTKLIHRSFEDPPQIHEADEETRLAIFRKVRDEIADYFREFVKEK